MSQRRYNDFGELLTSESFNLFFRVFEQPGVYQGLGVNAQSAGYLTLNPGVYLLPNAIVVSEDEPRHFLVTADTGGQYRLVARHKLQAIFGGQEVEYLIVREVDFEKTVKTYSFLILATFRVDLGVGIDSDSIQVPLRIPDLIRTLLNNGSIGKLSAEFPVPFSSGIHLLSGALPEVSVDGKKHYYPNFTGKISFQVGIPIGLRPKAVYVKIRSPVSGVSGTLAVTVWDSKDAQVPILGPSSVQSLEKFNFFAFPLDIELSSFDSLGHWTVNLETKEVDLQFLSVTFSPGANTTLGFQAAQLCGGVELIDAV